MAKQESDFAQTDVHDPFPMERLSAAVEEAIREVNNPESVREQHAILDRMTTDDRMKNVWALLLSRKRPSREFAYPARPRDGAVSKSPDEIQFDALRELFHFVFSAARDRMTVSKPIELQQSKEDLAKNAKTLRAVAHDLDLAAETGQLGVAGARDKQLATLNSASLRHVAGWLDQLSAAHRRPGDPMIVERHRGDPVVRGVQILIAVKMEELFGDRLDGTTATLTSVALGKKATAKTTRSAFKTQKSKKKVKGPKALESHLGSPPFAPKGSKADGTHAQSRVEPK
jgi:hypothetical protein